MRVSVYMKSSLSYFFMPIKPIHFLVSLTIFLISCEKDESKNGELNLLRVFIGDKEVNLDGTSNEDMPVDRSISLTFSPSVDQISATNSIFLKNDEDLVDMDINFSNSDKAVSIFPSGALLNNTVYTIEITDQLKGASGESFSGSEVSFQTVVGDLEIVSAKIADIEVEETSVLTDVPMDFTMTIEFTFPVDQQSLESETNLTGRDAPDLNFSYSNENKTVTITGTSLLDYLRKYTISISDDLMGSVGESFPGFSATFYTEVDETPKFPVISDEELLTKVQEQTFKYFWDFAHPISGLARERDTSGDLVTIGGSGFGVMAILVGVERGFITHDEAITRLTTIVDFLIEADRFHGAWPHWMNGATGEVIPFSEMDNGGDLVETAFMIQGLLTVREYLDSGVPEESVLIDKITVLWEEVEWDWYTQDGQNVLYWHWSPNFGWEMNHQISGYNEALIVYVLAAGSPTHPISLPVYEEGWARDGDIVNGNDYYSYELPLGYEYGGPLFFAHYSFLGLDPRNVSDQYGNYWEQNVHHSLINFSYCEDNPKNYIGYSDHCWGLTASDNRGGYSAHSPTNDLGVITPTAALSSMPYTPVESMQALKFFYYTIGDRVWKEYGFVDAFNITEEWYADSYLAIDQGPIIVMIENHRSGMLWDLFMTSPDVQDGLEKLTFNY